MRTIIGFLLLSLALISCKKSNEVGDINYKVKYTSSTDKPKSLKSDSLYGQFGPYITSLTPYHFSASINMMGMQDSMNSTDNTTIILSFIMHDGSDMTFPEPQADFSNNQVVDFYPGIGHQLSPGQEINLVYFYFIPYYIYQELILPAEYQNIVIDQFNEVYPVNFFGIGEEQYYCDSVKFGSILKTKYQPFITRIHPYPAGYPMGVVFGNTDSTFIFNKEGNLIFTSNDFPFGAPGQGSNNCMIRSNKYDVKTITIPEHDESLTIHITLIFNTSGLIQVYAGSDCIPYTSDDIFVYAPNYWERIESTLETY
jgi:hypothetical protein